MDDPMSLPPPVPPKDTPDRPPRPSTMDTDRATPASGSKRKRDGHDELAYNLRNSHLEAPDSQAHTPKRSRPSLQPSDSDASDDATPVQPRNVRRKKGVNNLSNLNLRHAAERQARQSAESQPVPRESKFQEGSLTDKPSGQPPTAFTRFTRTDSGNIHLVDDLMEDYHNGMPSPHRSVEIDIGREQAQTAQPTSAISSQAPSAEENNGFFFRFGRSLAASFHPVRMWKQVFEETHEELRQKNLAEIQRKKALKEEAERRYAQMKASGQFEPRVLSRASLADSNITLRDSGVIFASGTPSMEHKRATSHGSSLANFASENETPEVAPSATKTFRSRLSFKRPSLQNLRFDLKRAKSDYTLAAAANSQRDSSSSVSPVKAEFVGSALKGSQSKIDMRKQYKLSKRVSNLESKLQLARKELDDALVEASPMPKLGNKYERFTPYSTIKRPTFIPGKLESLPSERLLDPSQYNLETDEPNQVMDDHVKAATDLKAGSTEPLAHLVDLSEPDEPEEDTIRVTRARPYPPRASSLFNLNNKNIEDADEETAGDHTEPTKEDTKRDNMDVDSPSVEANGSRSEPTKAMSNASLDAKLKALDANVKMASKKPTNRKKRKSGDDMKDYKSRADDDDDEDAAWEKLGSRNKRRKSSGAPKKQAASKSATASDEPATNNTHDDADDADADNIKPAEPNDDVAAEPTARKSLDSQHAILAPVVEEDGEEAGSIKGDPVKKPTDSPQQDADTQLMTRAAEAAREHRSRSPPAHEEASLFKQMDGSAEQAAVVTKSGGAKSTKSGHSRSRKDKTKADESFEWPDDVF
ncbi:hypothetical protein Q7P35_001898 [Cladosporium inversicolor]